MTLVEKIKYWFFLDKRPKPLRPWEKKTDIDIPKPIVPEDPDEDDDNDEKILHPL